MTDSKSEKQVKLEEAKAEAIEALRSIVKDENASADLRIAAASLILAY